MENQSRRDFFKKSFLFLGAVASVQALPKFLQSAYAKAKEVALPAGMTAVPETDAVAQALGYKAAAKDVDAARYPQRKKKDAQNQFCKNCALYTSANDGWGKCQMLTAGVVAAGGWCGSWSKKA